VRVWLAEVSRYSSDNSFRLLIGNKSDRTDRRVTPADGTKLSEELKMPFIETSARTADNVEAAFVKMARELIRARWGAVNAEKIGSA
jgi:Ras-related protein Rab-1A